MKELTAQELHESIVMNTTIQRQFIDIYFNKHNGDEWPLLTRVKPTYSTPGRVPEMGTIIAYHQSDTGYTGWNWVLIDGAEIPQMINNVWLEKVVE